VIFFIVRSRSPIRLAFSITHRSMMEAYVPSNVYDVHVVTVSE
jgi:hypothetical protein